MKPKKKNLKASRVKMKAPGSDQGDIDTKPAGEGKEMDRWQMDRLEWCFHYELLKIPLYCDPV